MLRMAMLSATSVIVCSPAPSVQLIRAGAFDPENLSAPETATVYITSDQLTDTCHFPPTMPDWPTGNLQIAGLLCLGYLSVVGLFRRRRYNTIHEKYTPKFRAGTLTLQDAQEIIGLSMMYDMPALMNYSLAFALFKTYAIVRSLYFPYLLLD